MAMATNLRFFPTYKHRFMCQPPSSKARRLSPANLVIKSQIQSSQLQGLSQKKRRPENVVGDFFVDHTCIDCDTCRWMAPEIFTRVGDMSAVSKQPRCQDERVKTLQALLSCPTSSIRTEKPVHDILEIQKTFPLPIDMERIPGVYHCGYHSNKSYGAASYLLVHPEGNILIDSPRYTESLASNVEKMGGARYMFLTHRDDVADHEKWSKRLNCERVIHSTEVNVSTSNVEIMLNGCGPWSLSDDIQLIHTPGHTEGSVCLFYKPLKVLFTGDHLALATDESKLAIFEKYNFYSVPTQLESVALLLELEFEWILPGHGRRVAFKNVEDKNASLKAFLSAKQHTQVY
ncbi:hypothetical protein R6Q59_036466 [Mikania micrantha]